MSPQIRSLSDREGEVDTMIHLESAEQVFLTREFLYRDLLNALPAAIYTTDAAGRITFYNEAAVTFAGRRPALGDEWCVTWKLFHLDGRLMPHDECPMAVALKEGREIRGAEAIAERPDGTRVVFQPYPTVLRDLDGSILGAVNMLVDITERKQDEERQRLLADEVNHRANNLLAIVQSFVQLTKAPDVPAYKSAMSGRISALARAHNLLAKNRWQGADLHQLVVEELSPYMQDSEVRVWIGGANLPVEPAVAQCLAMIVHELATNAAKYGALSVSSGKLTLEWRKSPTGDLTFRWTETDGPLVEEPIRKGLGSTVIARSANQIGGKLVTHWLPKGLSLELCIPYQSVA